MKTPIYSPQTSTLKKFSSEINAAASVLTHGGLVLLFLLSSLAKATAGENLIPVTPKMLSGPLTFFATPAGVEFAEPVPYGFANNLQDRGWIWPNDNTGLLVVDFGVPAALTKVRVYCVYNGGERGALWAIERSSDNSSWVQVADFPYRQSQGGGVDDNGVPVDGFGGWYSVSFNAEAKPDRYWRIRQVEILRGHAPRSGLIEFYGSTGPSPVPIIKSVSPTENTTRKNAVIQVELEDGAVTKVAPASIQLSLNGQLVKPSVSKSPDSTVTTVSYDPKGSLREGANTVKIVFADTATPPATMSREYGFVVINDQAASLLLNIDFNGVRNDPGPDEPGPTFAGQGAGGGGTVWNGLKADSRTQIGLDDDDNLTVSGNNLLNSIGETTPVGFAISPVGGDVSGTASKDAKSSLALFSDVIFVGFGAQITLKADFTISGLGPVPYVDLYFYTTGAGLEVPGGREEAVVSSGIFKASNTRVFKLVPVSNGTVKGQLTGDPARLAGLTIVRAAPQPFVKSAAPRGGDIRRDASIKVELEDYTTQVAPGSIQLLLDGQAVTPVITKPAGSAITTVSFKPATALSEGNHTYQIVFGDTSSPSIVQKQQFSFFVLPDSKLIVTPQMLSGSLDFFASPAGLKFANPVPYGIANNVSDSGWIWPQDNSGLLDVDFGAPTALARFRVYSTYPSGGRGALWAIEASADTSTWVPIVEFPFETKAGLGLNDDGTKRTDFGGWYEMSFNHTGAASYRYWRVRQVTATVGHAPRAGQVEFHSALPEPIVLSTAPTGQNVKRDDNIVMQLKDNRTAVALNSIKLFLNGQQVQPSVERPAGSLITTVTYDPPIDLPEGVNTLRITFNNNATPPVSQTHDFSFAVAVAETRITVQPEMLSGPLKFFASPAGLQFGDPIPYGITNNVTDKGWIWPQDNAGALTVDFGIPLSLNKFRVYSTYPGDGRGANWAIEYSNDKSTWGLATDFAFVTKAGGGVNGDGSKRTDFGGWYESTFNADGAIGARFWRVRQTKILVGHAPRAGQVEFYGDPLPPLAVTPAALSGSLNFFASPAGLKHANPIPYGIANNVADRGWIWPQDNSGLLAVDFQLPVILQAFRVYSSFPGDGRGALWAIEHSTDNINWTGTADFPFQTKKGVGVNDDGTARTDFGGWYGMTFNETGASARYWRVRQTKITVGHAPRAAQAEFYGAYVAPLAVQPEMLSGPLTFFASPAGLKHAAPIPYGIANNTSDRGWIWPQDNSGLLTVDFGQPQAVNIFRVFSSYPGDGRGALWAIEYSSDNTTWTTAIEYPFETKKGAGVNEDGSPRTDFGGWYQANFNAAGVAARYWRVRQVRITVGHAPRAAEVEFYAIAAAAPALVLQISASGGNVILSWQGAATLQSTENVVGGQWADVGTTSPQTVAPSAAHRFYRLRQ